MDRDDLEFNNVPEESQQKIREAVGSLQDKRKSEGWNVKVDGTKPDNFKIWVTAPDGVPCGPFLIRHEAVSEIVTLLESSHKQWQIRATPPVDLD
jgi:hypothetical protein